MTIDDLQIGGRNLVPDTSFTRGALKCIRSSGFNEYVMIRDSQWIDLNAIEGRKYIHAFSSVVGDNYYYLEPCIFVLPQETYTLSFYYRIGGAVSGNSSFIRFDTDEFVPMGFNPNKSVWTKGVFTFTTPIDVSTVQLRFGIHNAGDAWLAISSIKLEKGNVATDWSPAPEDIAMLSDIPTSLPASDVYDWAKRSIKPSYSASEISGLPTVTTGTGNPPASGMKKGDIFIKTS